MQQDFTKVIEALHPLLHQLDPRLRAMLGLRIETVVMDANVVFRDLRAAHRKGRPTILAEALQLGYLRAFAPVHLSDEVRFHLPRLEAKWGIPLGTLTDLWRELYVPYIHWLEVEPSIRRSFVAELQTRDPKDTPYLEVYDQTGAAVVLTADNDIKDLGVAPPDWFQYASASASESRERHTIAAVYLGTTLTLLSTGHIAALAGREALRLLRRVVAWFLRLPLAAQLGILAGLAIILLNPSTQKRLQDIWRHAVRDVSKGARSLGEAFRALVQFVNQHEYLAREAHARKGTLDIGPGKPLFAKDYVVRVLVESTKPMSTVDITERVLELGYQTTSSCPERYIGRVLAAHPSVVRVRGQGWALVPGLLPQ